MSLKLRSTRRSFLRTTGLAATTVFAAPALLRAKSPNEKLNLACIGVADRAAANNDACSGENIVALCDIDDDLLAGAARRWPKAHTFSDFRKLLTTMTRQIDAVIVSTPDHMHAPVSMLAMHLGKPVYCEKPLAHNVFEVRQMAALAKKQRLVTQMGIQIHAEENYRRVVEMIDAGVIGPIEEVHVWCHKSWSDGRRPKETPPVPAQIHWDTWLGPAPERPYHPCYLRGGWRRWWDFGNGTLGDMACHIMDLAFWALKLRHPTTIHAEGPTVDPEGCPKGLTVRYEFAGHGSSKPLKLTWYDGPQRHQLPGPKDMPLGDPGILFVGKDGMLLADYGRRTLYPQDKFRDYRPPAPTLTSIGHHQEFLQACKTGGPTTCNFDYSSMLSEAVLLGGVAFRCGQKLEWDAAAMRATNCPQADYYLHPEYRKGWVL
jgi:predicted dehydrogenase